MATVLKLAADPNGYPLAYRGGQWFKSGILTVDTATLPSILGNSVGATQLEFTVLKRS